MSKSGKSSLRQPHVALLVETSLASGRDILRGIARFARERSSWSLYHEPRSLEDALPSWLQQWDGHGIIARIQTKAMARAITRTGIPTVDVLGVIPNSGFPLVHVDDRAIAEGAAEHLLERGFTNFGFLGIQKENWSEHREQAFTEHLRKQVFKVHCYRVPRHEPAGRSWETQQDALAQWIRELPKPVGLMVCSDQRGPQLLEACRRANALVPDEVAVIGVDNDEPLCDVSNPPLTSVWPGHAHVGYQAAALLEKLMKGRKPPSRPIWIPPQEVVTRRSTEVLAVGDQAVATALRMIREHACNRVRVDEIALAAGVSRSVLQRRFRQTLNRTVHEELVHQRIRRAQQLLAHTDLSMLDIAERAGFEHQEYMGSVFKKHLRLTPAQFRRQSQKNGQ